MSALARYSAIDRTTLTRNVDHLAAQGLVERRSARRDRRQVGLELSERGKAVCERALRIVAQEDVRLLRAASPTDLNRVTRLLEGMIAGLADEDEAAAIIGFAAGAADRA